MAKKKQQEIEFNDEYFLNLTMKYDERNDDIYPKWAMWCANSEDKYYIDGKDGYFYTHIRTPEEIAKERKRREIQELISDVNTLSDKEIVLVDFNERVARDYLALVNLEIDWLKMSSEEKVSKITPRYLYSQNTTPLPYEEWKNQSKESAE